MNRLIAWEVLFRFILVLILVTLMVFSLNFPVEGIFYDFMKNVLVIVFIFFLPGYMLLKLFFKKDLKFEENLLLSLGLSVSLTIISAMAIYFIRMEISIYNILNVLSILTLILISIPFLKTEGKVN